VRASGYGSVLLSLVAPPRCGACGVRCERQRPLCARCASALASARPEAIAIPGIDMAWAAAPYSGAAPGIVRGLKFGRLLPLARVAAEAIRDAAPADLLGAALVPVPPAPLRLRLRGFDPAEEIAFELSALTGSPMVACLWRRQGPRQVGRPRAERIASPPVVEVRAPVPSRATLVDDVVTTGATLGACARALESAGCERVAALAFAHSRKGLGAEGPQA
jgi:predicted amidophosphoribosyltransferase